MGGQTTNSAALHEKDHAYMLWGVDDESHEIIGTDKNLQNIKVGNQELENWLRSLLSDNAEFEFHDTQVNNKRVCVLIICKATNQPVTFQKVDYIRVGSYTHKLKDYPPLQAQLWDKLRSEKFEEQYARYDLALPDALQLIDCSFYFEMMNLMQPTSIDGVEHYMTEEGVLVKQDNGLYAITNMGALLFARKISAFSKLARKAVRVVQYRGTNRMSLLKETTIEKGYAVGFEEMLKYIEALIPAEEAITSALRETKTAYPLLAIRESVANALIRQNFAITGTGPIIEVFENRIEITNPGTPLVDVARIIDNPPKSRNEKLAALMRRLRICEELGTGWDKITISCELAQLPAPKIDLYKENTKVTLFSYTAYSDLSPEDKLWACYLHACVKQVQGEQITNRSLRLRFGLTESGMAGISRLIKDAVEMKFIKAVDPTTAPRYMKYIPIWA